MTAVLSSMPVYLTLPSVLIGYSITCFGVGVLFLRLLETRFNQIERISAGTIVATEFILGQGILAGIWLLLALCGWFSFPVVASASFLFAVIGLYLGRKILVECGEQVRRIWHELREDTWGWQCLAALVILIWILWSTSLARPLTSDGTAFYLAFGKLIAFSQRLVPMPGYEGFSNVGLQGELHFAALTVLHSPESAKLFSWPTILMAGIMLASLARVTGMRRRGQWLVLTMLFSSTAVNWLSGDGKVDLFGLALGLAAYYWAFQIRFGRRSIALLLTGLLTGFAIVAKLSYGVVMVPSVGLLVVWRYLAGVEKDEGVLKSLKSFLGDSLVILTGLILAFVPHFIKNGLLFHNPISPIGSGGVGWLNQSWFSAETTRKILLTYPLALTYGSYWAQYGNISPLVLAFLPLSLFLPRPRHLVFRSLLVITLAGLLAIMMWLLYSPSVLSPRYILASLLLLTLLPAQAAEYVTYHDQRPRLLSFSILILAISTLIFVGLYFLNLVFFPANTVSYLKGNLTECARDQTLTRICIPIEIINHEAKQGDRVYLASSQRYWFRGDLIECLSNKEDIISSDAKGNDLWLELFENGFKFLLIDTSTYKTLANNLDLTHLPEWVELSTLYEEDSLYAYKITFTHPPSNHKPKICQRMPSSRIWEVISP